MSQHFTNTDFISLSCCLTLVVLTIAPAFGQNPAEQNAQTLDQARQHFAEPPASFRPAPLYVWNEDMQEDELSRQMKDFKEQGYGGVFVHPRPGLLTPYLSDRWLKLWRHTNDVAVENGMVTYIYDENSYPSGFAGGHVAEQMPEARQVKLQHRRIEPDKLNELVIDSDSIALFRDLGGEPAKYERVALPKLAKGETKTAADLGVEAAAYELYSYGYGGRSAWMGGGFYTDLGHPGATEKFLDITLGAYDTVLSDVYGKSVLACFTDEPHAAHWTPDLPQVFEKRWGYDLMDVLPSLTLDVGDWRRVRHNYSATVLEIFIERFCKPYYQACEERGIASTGHDWEHGWPGANSGPDTMSFNAWQHMPGIDCLMNQYREDPHAQFGNYRANKEISSIANQFGRVRTLCEAYGAGGWELTFEDMKRIGDWLCVGGVNLMNPHLTYYTIRGARKRDHPLSASYHAPYWEGYHLISDYTGRLCWALSAGVERNPILVIEPTTTAWMYSWGGSHRDHMEKQGAAFQSYITELGAAQVEFDLGSEPVMAAQASVEGAQLRVGKSTYSLVILPPGLENLDRSTVKLLRKFAQNGGNILSCVGVPKYIDGRPRKGMQGVKKTAGNRWIEDDISPVELARSWGHTNVLVSATAPKGGRVFHMLRQLDDGDLLFISNCSLEEATSGYATARAGGVELWDLANGGSEAYPYEVVPGSGAGDERTVSWDFHLPPAGSALFVLPRKGKGAPVQPVRLETELVAAGKTRIEQLEPNVLPLDYVDLVLKGETSEGLYFYDAQTRIYQAHGFDRNPWDSAVQFKDELLQKDNFPADSGFELRYPFTVDGYKGGLRLVVERGDRYTVSVNGKTLEAIPGEWWLDRAFPVYEIPADCLKSGRNVVSTVGQPFTLHHEPEPVYLLGDFNLKSAEKGFVLAEQTQLKHGPWKKQGRPLYPGKVAYTRTFKRECAASRYAVELQKWDGTVARVDVNGEKAGYIGWQPWTLDITDKLKSGSNEVSVVVIGSLKNLLGPHHNGSPRGSAWPSMFKRHPEGGQPAGDGYDVMPYGLRKPFKILMTSTQ